MHTDQAEESDRHEEESARYDHGDNSESTRPTPTPLPKFQLFMVILIQFAEPVTATVIYPFINQFVRDTGVTKGDERKTGYYAGIIESAFFFAEALSVFHWGWLSDRIGRRPVLLIGPFGLCLATLGFGLSTTFWPLVIYRCFQGVFNGNIGVSKSVMAELTDSTNIGDAFATLPLMWSTGITIAPIMGGILSNPTETWPKIFGQIAFLRTHPYFLPCLAAATISLVSFVIGFIGLKETLPSAIAKQKLKESRRAKTISPESSLIAHGGENDYGTNGIAVEYASEGGADATAAKDIKAPPLREVITRSILLVYANYAFLAFTDMSFQVLLPLMFSTSIPLGGLGMDPYRIGTILGTWGLFNAFIQIRFMGPLLRKYGARKTYIVSYSGFFVCIGMFPITSYFAKRAGGIDVVVGVLIGIQLLFRTMISTGYGSMHVVIVESAPSKAALGSVNGLAQMVGSVTRSIAPTIASSLFSVSLERRLAGGNIVYFILLGAVLAGIWTSLRLPRRSPASG